MGNSLLRALSKTKSRALVALLTLGFLMAVTVSPVGAQDVGAGSAAGTGSEEIVQKGDYGTQLPNGERLPTCAPVQYTKYEVDVYGAYTAADPGPHGRVQTVTLHFEMGERKEGSNGDLDPSQYSEPDDNQYYFGPHGTFGPDDAVNKQDCDPADFGPAGPVETKVWVTSSSGNVECGSESAPHSGQYFRVDGSFTVTWTGSCDVGSNSTPSDTQHVFEGHLLPCAPTPPSGNTCDESAYAGNQLQGVWTYGGAQP